MEKHVIWDQLDPICNFENWVDDLKDSNPDIADDEEALRELAIEINDGYLGDERLNLGDIKPSNGVVGIADLGFWYGRRNGLSKEDLEGVADCLRSFCDSDSHLEIYVDENGDLCSREAHHDGVNLYLFRAWKPNVSEEQKEEIRDGQYTTDEFNKLVMDYTYRLGDLIGDVYGWEAFPDRPVEAAKGVCA